MHFTRTRQCDTKCLEQYSVKSLPVSNIDVPASPLDSVMQLVSTQAREGYMYYSFPALGQNVVL